MVHPLPRSAALPILVAAAVAGCHRHTAPAPEPGQRADDPVGVASGAAARDGGSEVGPREGSLLVGLRPVHLAVYLTSPPSPAVLKAAQDAAKARFPGVTVETQPGPLDPPAALVFAPRIEDFPPPTEAQMPSMARGLDPLQARAAASSNGVIVAAFAFDSDPALSRMREAEALVLAIAQQNAGFVWDDTTRQIYATSAWNDDRLQGWDGDRPDMLHHVVVHYYPTDGGRHRAITLGMAKFGLPDLVGNDVPESEAGPMTTLLDAAAQLLVEGAPLERGGRLQLDLTAIRHPGAHDALIGTAGHGAQLRGPIDFASTVAEPGDPDNRLLALRFSGYPGATEAERQAAAIIAILGGGDDR
jgi:hypothetical protein